MIYFLAIFLTPLAFFVKGKIIQGIISLILWLISLSLVLSLIGSFLGFILWVAIVIWCILVIKDNNNKINKGVNNE